MPGYASTIPSRTRILALTALAVGLGNAGCTRSQQGVLVLEWSVTSPLPDDPDPCATAGISHVEITVGHEAASTTPPVFVFPCAQGRAKIPLPEGIYEVTLSEQFAEGSRPVAHFDAIEVLGGTERDWHGDYPPDPPDANSILLPWCGDGLVEADEACDDATANSDVMPDACRTDCTPAHCGDGVKDTGEQCDGDQMGEASCTSLGFAAGTLACRSDCHFDTSGCQDARADLVLTWTVTLDGTTPSDCPSQGIARVHYELADRDGRPVISGYGVCLAGSVTLEALPFGIYDVYLQGLDEHGAVIASAAAFNRAHESLSGTSISLPLVPVP